MKVEYKALELETDPKAQTVTLRLGEGGYSTTQVIIPAAQINLVIALLTEAETEFDLSKPYHKITDFEEEETTG